MVLKEAPSEEVDMEWWVWMAFGLGGAYFITWMTFLSFMGERRKDKLLEQKKDAELLRQLRQEQE